MHISELDAFNRKKQYGLIESKKHILSPIPVLKLPSGNKRTVRQIHIRE